MVRVAGHAVADNLGDNFRAATLRKFERFEDQNARAFAHHEAIAFGVERTAGAFRFVIARGKRAHGGESADAHGGNGSFRATRDHHFRIAALNDLERVAHGVRRSGASRGRGGVRALRAIANRNVARGEIHNCRRNEKGRNLAGTT